MREILFRGKRLKIGPFAVTTTDEWVYGCYVKDSISTYIHSPMESSRMVSVDPSTVGEYTGLRDKNGKRIFEGDIVIYGDTVHEAVFEQRNKTAYFGLVYSPIETLPFGHYQDLKQIEVIGNIYDNQELLEAENG